ncbi:MAG: class F420-dependent oxidoreductase, partial [Acidimicrobiia bacterium]|nr:class F420-dependent oxidoreductase [Acidimicrobiia bacterium]
RAIGEHLAPEITRAADHASRPAPRVVAGVPVCVTNNVSRARELAAARFGFYGGLPSYRAMLDREGVAEAADIAIIGDEASVSSQLRSLADAGATDVMASPFGSAEERSATLDVLSSL